MASLPKLYPGGFVAKKKKFNNATRMNPNMNNITRIMTNNNNNNNNNSNVTNANNNDMMYTRQQHELAYHELTLGNQGMVINRNQKLKKRERHGYCTTCVGPPIKLYDVKNFKLPWERKEAISKPGICQNGICFVCYPQFKSNNNNNRMPSPVCQEGGKGNSRNRQEPRRRRRGRRHSTGNTQTSISSSAAVAPATNSNAPTPRTSNVVPRTKNYNDYDRRARATMATATAAAAAATTKLNHYDNEGNGSVTSKESGNSTSITAASTLSDSNNNQFSSNLQQQQQQQLPTNTTTTITSLLQSPSAAMETVTHHHYPKATPPAASPTSSSFPMQEQIIKEQIQMALNDIGDCSNDDDKDTSLFAQVVVDCMKEYKNLGHVQCYCLHVIWEKCRECDCTKKSFLASGVSEHIIYAMRKFFHCQTLQQNGCGAIWALSIDLVIRISLIRAGACQRIVHAIETSIMEYYKSKNSNNNNNHGNNNIGRKQQRSSSSSPLSLMQTALGALRVISQDEEAQNQYQKFDISSRVVNAMKLYPHDASIQRDGCSVLLQIAVDKERQVIASTVPYAEIETLVAAMINHERDISIICAAVHTLYYYVKEYENRQTLSIINGVEMIFHRILSQNQQTRIFPHETLRNAEAILFRIQVHKDQQRR